TLHLRLDDHREPETELAQPDRGGILVDTEDRAREHVASNVGDASFLARGATEVGQSFKCVNEERAGATRGIEDGQLLETRLAQSLADSGRLGKAAGEARLRRDVHDASERSLGNTSNERV